MLCCSYVTVNIFGRNFVFVSYYFNSYKEHYVGNSETPTENLSSAKLYVMLTYFHQTTFDQRMSSTAYISEVGNGIKFIPRHVPRFIFCLKGALTVRHSYLRNLPYKVVMNTAQKSVRVLPANPQF